MSLKRLNTYIRLNSDNFRTNNIFRTALDKAGYIVENRAKELCPVGDDGQLRQSISHRIDNNNAVYISAKQPYAIYAEYGTGIYAIHGDGRKDVPWSYQDEQDIWHTTYGERPQPYLHPALEQTRDEVVRIFRQTIREEVGRRIFI